MHQNTQDRLNTLLKDFIRADVKHSDCANTAFVADSPDTASYELKRCAYCGRAENFAPITVGRFNENLCLFCKRDLVEQNGHCQQIVDEVAHNMEYLFAVPWNKQVKVKECTVMKELNPKRNWIGTIVHKCIVWLKSKIKWLNYPAWEVSIRPNIVQAKMKAKWKTCVFKIRTDAPSGVITAEIVYAIVKDYLGAQVEKGTLNSEWAAGLAAWYMIHYLYNMDYKQYGKYYHDTMEEWGKEGIAVYKVLRGKKHPDCGRIMPLSWGISQFHVLSDSNTQVKRRHIKLKKGNLYHVNSPVAGEHAGQMLRERGALRGRYRSSRRIHSSATRSAAKPCERKKQS